MRLLGSLVPLHHGPIAKGVEGLSLPLMQVFLPYHHCSSTSTGRKLRLRERFHDFLYQVLDRGKHRFQGISDPQSRSPGSSEE